MRPRGKRQGSELLGNDHVNGAASAFSFQCGAKDGAGSAAAAGYFASSIERSAKRLTRVHACIAQNILCVASHNDLHDIASSSCACEGNTDSESIAARHNGGLLDVQRAVGASLAIIELNNVPSSDCCRSPEVFNLTAVGCSIGGTRRFGCSVKALKKSVGCHDQVSAFTRMPWPERLLEQICIRHMTSHAMAR